VPATARYDGSFCKDRSSSRAAHPGRTLVSRWSISASTPTGAFEPGISRMTEHRAWAS